MYLPRCTCWVGSLMRDVAPATRNYLWHGASKWLPGVTARLECRCAAPLSRRRRCRLGGPAGIDCWRRHGDGIVQPPHRMHALTRRRRGDDFERCCGYAVGRETAVSTRVRYSRWHQMCLGNLTVARPLKFWTSVSGLRLAYFQLSILLLP